MRKRILIADDHPTLRAGLYELLSSRDGLEVVGEAEDGLEAVRCADRLKPDLILMDLSMPNLSGLDAIRSIRRRHPAMRILVLTMHRTEDHARASLEAGADGFLSKEADESEILLAVERVLSGEAFVSPEFPQ
jgi:DNA-binding NarL/FixJ family response regulator